MKKLTNAQGNLDKPRSERNCSLIAPTDYVTRAEARRLWPHSAERNIAEQEEQGRQRGLQAEAQNTSHRTGRPKG